MKNPIQAPKNPESGNATPCNADATLSFRAVAVEIDAPKTNQGTEFWIHLVPRGEALSKEEVPLNKGDGTRQVWVKTVFDEAALTAMRENFQPDILIDYEHSDNSPDPASSTAAAGWGRELRPSGDGLESLVDWTPTAARQIEERIYRFISPVVDGEWENLGAAGTREDPVIFRPRVLREAGLTNRPKLHGRLRPLKYKSDNSETQPKNQNTMDYKKELCLAFGLKPDADDEAITAALKARKQAPEPDPDKLDRTAEMEAKLAAMEEERLEADVEAHKEVIEDEEAARALFKIDRPNALKLFGSLKNRLANATPPHGTIHNRTTKPAGIDKADDRADRVAALANKLAREEGLSLGEAHRRAESEIK